ncbi:MAG TPA: Hpt domain-containing protein, partial [Thermomonas sp.]|uniref:Hpt domain-containing protein n=1 Tax=Thermomonas sp. TaxID=1971895 RepID=UPI002C10812D
MTTVQRDAIDHAALGWVKPEIDEALRQARIELEAFAEAPADAAPMHACMGHLHQVQGTLRMLELQTPAMVSVEMEQVAAALQAATTPNRDEALAALMRGLVQLPDYLERLQGGHRDIPIVLLPLINDLRAAHGAAPLSQDQLPSLLVAPSEAEIEHARGSLAGRNRALLDTVSSAIKEDMLKVKDALDLYLRGNRSNVQDLMPQADALDKIGDTLGMLGLDSASAVVQEQRALVQAIASSQRPFNEADLLDVAGALIYIDHSLDDQVARLGSGTDSSSLLAQESGKVMGALTQATIGNFAEVRNAFVAFVETNWDHASLAKVPRLLAEVAGVLRMVDQVVPAGYLDALQAYTQAELIDRKYVPGGRQLDTLADALASMEYYLESLHDPLGQRLDLLDKTREYLEVLRYWPIPQADVAATVPPVSDAAEDSSEAPVELTAHEAAAPAQTSVSSEEEPIAVAAPAAVTAAAEVATNAEPVAAGFESMGEEIDDEIREIFLEEFQDEIANLDTLMPAWRIAPEDAERLRPIRRVYHTLKGSGRLVGAKVLGEFAWHVESMMNRVLDGSRPATTAVLSFAGLAHQLLPQLHAALLGEGKVAVDIAAMEAIADRLAAGEDVELTALPLVQASAAPAHVEPVIASSSEHAATAETTAVTVDPILLDILGTEVGSHLETVDAWLEKARSGKATVNDGLIRAIHTLNGAFAMTEVVSVTAFTAPAEGYVKRLFGAQADADATGIAAIAEMAAAVKASTKALQTTPDQVPLHAALAAHITALRDALPESSLPFIDGAQRVEAERAEVERIEAERAEAERIEAERVEAERVEAERVEAERVEA